MKRLIIGSLILVAAVGSVILVEGKRVARHLYLREETMLRHLKKEPFLTKTPSPWMLEQIEEDFQKIQMISKEALEEVFTSIKELSPMLVRYRIVNNELYRYFVEGEPISLVDNSTEKAIKTITQRTELPDMDFIVSYFDGYPFNQAPSDLKAPILVSAKLKNTPNGILIPDWRSIGHWWMSDIKAIKKAQKPWEKKRPFALWRGGLTNLLRFNLCKLSFEFPEILDARLSSHPADPELKKQVEEEGLMGNRSSWDEFLSCKYLPYVDGVMCAAPALQWRLLSGSLTFKPESDEIQWFYRSLEPNVHYVAVKKDLSDLIEKIVWAKEHDNECRQIAERASCFAKENLMYSDVLNYFALVLKRYGSHQQLVNNELIKEIRNDPRWVKIQCRRSLCGLAKRSNMLGYCKEGTPPAM